MTQAPQRYPLAWPAHRPRAKARTYGKFSTKDTSKGYAVSREITVAQAFDRLQSELDRMGAQYALLSSNIETRLDGQPRSGQPEPVDPGVCAYFTLDGKPIALACDRYSKTAQNIAALAAHIEATRAISRYGVASAAETLEAFAALPAPTEANRPARPWWEVLGIMRESAEVDIVRSVHRTKCKAAAAKGDEPALLELNLARDAALAELSA
jgi:hypothetical protein